LPVGKGHTLCLPADYALGKCLTHIIVQGTATVSSDPSIVYHPIPELLHPGRLYIGRCNGYWSADRCVMQRYGLESVVVAIATLFNNKKMAGTLEQEPF
jgi:hypothetical protein